MGITKRFRNALRPNKLPDADIVAAAPPSIKLLILKECAKDRYDDVTRIYKTVFPFIENCDVSSMAALGLLAAGVGDVPVFVIKERNVNALIPIQELSSGMQKVLIILADIVSLDQGYTYLIDEYENSLGVNAIDFLPSFLVDYQEGKQFIITTHHPYLINNMPVKDWRLFQREGSHVTVVNGDELSEKFGKSKQQAFVQLINAQQAVWK